MVEIYYKIIFLIFWRVFMSKKSIPVFVSDDQKYIPESDLKLLVDFLRMSVNADLKFNAAYDAVMNSFPVQARLFKALTDRKDAYVDVKVSRKPRKILLKFSALPESLVSAAFVEAEQKKDCSEISIFELEPLQVEKNETVTISKSVQSDSVTLDSSQFEKKRKGRGKAKKQAPARSLVSVLIDNSDLDLLNELAIKKDYNVSQLIRLAVRRLVSSHSSSF